MFILSGTCCRPGCTCMPTASSSPPPSKSSTSTPATLLTPRKMLHGSRGRGCAPSTRLTLTSTMKPCLGGNSILTRLNHSLICLNKCLAGVSICAVKSLRQICDNFRGRDGGGLGGLGAPVRGFPHLLPVFPCTPTCRSRRQPLGRSPQRLPFAPFCFVNVQLSKDYFKLKLERLILKREVKFQTFEVATKKHSILFPKIILDSNQNV